MLPIKLQLSDGFLEEETRNGYVVEKKMKEHWAVILDLLNEVLTFCEANNIPVYAAYGTLLGAIRHNGMIPWDDDIDLVMKREDYERFCRTARFEAPYFLQNEYTDIGFSRDFTRLRNSETTCIQVFEKDMKIGYNQGCFVDIFPMDGMPAEKELRQQAGREARKLREQALRWSLFSFRAKKKECCNGKNEKIKTAVSGISVPLLTKTGIHNPYIKKLKNLAGQYRNTGLTGNYWFYNPEKDDDCFSEEDYSKAISHPFEMLQIPVPVGYEHVLEHLFGDWRTPVMAGNDHGSIITDCHTPYREFLKNSMKES